MTEEQALIAPRAKTVSAPVREEQILLRAGGVCAAAGAVIFAISLAGHGDLPTHISNEAGLRFVAAHTNWLLMHLGTIVAGLLWVGAFNALAATLRPGVAGALGPLLIPSSIIGGMFVTFDYAVDGYAFKIIADEWIAATGPAQADLMVTFDTLLGLGSGTLRAEMLVFSGLMFLLAGLAVAWDGRYPVWFGGIGALAGALATLAGLSAFAGLSLRIDVLVFVVALPIEGLWMLALGMLMWRAARVSE